MEQNTLSQERLQVPVAEPQFSAQGHTWPCSNLQTQPKTQTFPPHPPPFFITGKGIIPAVGYDVKILSVIFAHITFFGGPYIQVVPL